MLQATHLTCEYETNPLGIGTRRPRFGWWVETEKKETMQTIWQIQVALDPDFRKIIWDSEPVPSDASTQVAYEGKPLVSETRYYWRVRVQDNYGDQSDWSETAWFETSLLDPTLWQALFISPETPEDADSSAARRLRKAFTLPGHCIKARLYVTALGLYEVNINGKRVGDDLLRPGWTEYQKRLQFQTYDVTDFLQEGDNVIGATLGCGWYKGDLAGWIGRRHVYGKQTALSLQLHIDFDDGSGMILTTDETWRWCHGPILMSELYHGEIYDARLEDPGWDEPSYDDKHWHPVFVLPFEPSLLVPQEGPPVRRQEELKPIAVFTTPKGEQVLDFGQNLAGFVRFTTSGLSGEKVILRHAEILDAEGNFYTDNMRSAKNTIEYTLHGGTVETYEPHFTFQGFRYVHVVSWPGPIDADSFTAVVIHSDFPFIGSFSCSNEKVNQLHHNILWSMKGNFIDIPTDCPQRDERLGWTGDAQVFASTAARLGQVASFFTKWLHDLALAQRPDGAVPHVVPDVLNQYSATGWGDAAVICPWVIWQAFSDKRLLEDMYPTMKAWVLYIQKQARDGLIWDSGFHFGDWVALDAKEGSYFGATPNDLIATAFYAHSTDLLAQAATVLGYEQDALTFRQLHSRIVAAYQDEFITPAGRLAAMTQTAHILTLHFGLAKPHHHERMVNSLLKLLEKTNGHLETGFLGTPYFCQVLSDNGCLKQAYDLLLKEDYPSWLYPISKGATTIWEHWDGIKPDGTLWSADMNSFNHYAYGSIGDFLYRVVAGLDTDPIQTGYKRIQFAPQPGGGLTRAEASRISAYGPIRVKWQIEDHRMTIQVVIPPNTTARLVLPQADRERFIHHPNLDRSDPDQVVMELGSGIWIFQYAWPEPSETA